MRGKFGNSEKYAQKRMKVGRPFEKGNPGKPKGAVNIVTKTVKETVLAVFNIIQDDPEVNLEQFAKNYPKEFYAIAAKLIPTEVQATVDTTIVWQETKTYATEPKTD